MPKSLRLTFNGNITVESRLTITGGVSKQCHVLNSMEVDGETFIEMKKTENWICRMIGGYHCNNSPLKRTRFLETLRAAAHKKATPALAGGDSDSDDPMQTLCPAGAPPTKRPRGRGRAGGRGGRGRGRAAVAKRTLMEGPVDVKAPCSVSVTVENVRIYVRGDSSRTSTLWVAVDSVPAVLSALRAEFESHGVPAIENVADGDVGEGDEAALVAGVAREVWFDYRSRAWIVGQRGGAQDKHITMKKFPVPQCKRGSSELLGSIEYKEALEAIKKKAMAWAEAETE